jgi:glucosyl-3-phosphoglycerate synthase
MATAMTLKVKAKLTTEELWNSLPYFRLAFDNCGNVLAAKSCSRIEEAELTTGPGGKGRNVWLCFGYVLASEQARMVAVHDCDIVTYNRELLARLCYPVAHPAFGFDFCKGYYTRVSMKTLQG